VYSPPFRVLSSPVNVSPGHDDGHCSPWRAVSVSVSADVDRSCRLVCLSSSPVNVSPGHEDGHCSPWRAVSVFVSAAVDRAVGCADQARVSGIVRLRDVPWCKSPSNLDSPRSHFGGRHGSFRWDRCLIPGYSIHGGCRTRAASMHAIARLKSEVEGYRRRWSPAPR